MYNRRFTPDRIEHLNKNEVFVFGSNLAGQHGGGAARIAYGEFGAIWGQGVGMQGQSYAIPTMHGGVAEIKPYVDQFIEYAKQHDIGHVKGILLTTWCNSGELARHILHNQPAKWTHTAQIAKTIDEILS